MSDRSSHFWTPRPAYRSWGQLRPTVLAAPAAGADWAYVTRAGFVTRIVSCHALLTASAQVAERGVSLVLTDTNNTYYKEHSPAALKAGEAVDVNAGQGGAFAQPVKSGAGVGWELPELLIPAGWELKAETASLQTEDKWSAVAVLVEEFEECPDREPYHVHKLIQKLHELREAQSYG